MSEGYRKLYGKDAGARFCTLTDAEVRMEGDQVIEEYWEPRFDPERNGYFLLEKFLNDLRVFQEMYLERIIDSTEYSDAIEVLTYARDKASFFKQTREVKERKRLF
jgi:hypothetical protein